MPEKKHLVVIEDEKNILQLYELVLQREDRELHLFSNHSDANEWLKNNTADAILTDEKIIGQNYTGVEWVKELRKSGDDTPVMVVSATVNPLTAKAAGAQKVLHKPPRLEELEKALDEAGAPWTPGRVPVLPREN